MKPRINTLFFTISVCLLTAALGCANTPSSTKMVPAFDYSKLPRTGKTLSIVPPRVQEQKRADTSSRKIKAEDFQAALLRCLQSSGMFRQILVQYDGDYQLHAEIVSPKVIPGFTANVVLFVHYSLTDTVSKETVWKEGIVSQYNGYGGDLTAVLEGAVRANLTNLLQKISQVLSSASAK